jgi:ribosome recycling factor
MTHELTVELAREWNYQLAEHDNLKRALKDKQAAEDRAEKARLAIQRHFDNITRLLQENDDVPA